MSDQPELAPLVGRMRASAEDFARLAPRVTAGAPWPLSDDIGASPEAHWGPPEVLAHVAEMLQFWTGEVERVLDGRGETAVPFGRVATNELRIGIIDRDRTLPARELFSRIDAGVARLARRLEELTPGEAARAGLHPTLGEFTVATIVETFVAGHLEDHVEQLREALRGA